MFDHRDHLVGINNRGVTTLLLDPIIDGFHLSRVIMDGDSSLSLIYEDTLNKMQFDKSRILLSKTTLKGIIPVRDVHCTGKVTLDVLFKTLDNNRIKALSFDIVSFWGGYHALLWPVALSRVPCCAPLHIHEIKDARARRCNYSQR